VTNWVIDLDGVMWRGSRAIPGSTDAVAELIQRGDRVVFCTNNSAEAGTQKAARLVEDGLPEGVEVVTSADAVAGLVRPGEVALCLGGPGLRRALRDVGAEVHAAADELPVDAHGEPVPFDVVVVGLARDADYTQIDRASATVRRGARLLASNADATYPGTDRLHPGCGAILAAVETAAGTSAEVAGKPHEPMAEVLRRRLDGRGVVVGDRADTDGRLAELLDWPFALVLSGVTTPDDLPVEVPTAVVAEDLLTVVDTFGAWSGESPDSSPDSSPEG